MEEQEERPGLSLPIGVPQTKHLRGWVAGKGSVCECQSVKRAEDKNITKREREREMRWRRGRGRGGAGVSGN
jgi:hypothetical protein